MILRVMRGLLGSYPATEDELAGAKLVVSRAVTAHTSYNSELAAALNNSASQASVYLTHVSLMIAVTAVFLATGDKGHIYDAVMIFETIGYLMLALLCIRCQFRIDETASRRAKSLAKPSKFPGDDTEQQAFLADKLRELVFRDNLLRFLMWAVYVLTALLMLTLILGAPINFLFAESASNASVEL